MDFSNRHTNEFVNLCDLENVLGGVSVCYARVRNSVNTAVVNGVNVAIFDFTGGNADSELLLRKSLKNIVISDFEPKSEVDKCTNAFVSCHCERSEAIHSCHYVVNTESEVYECKNAFAGQILSQAQNDSINHANKKKRGVK